MGKIAQLLMKTTSEKKEKKYRENVENKKHHKKIALLLKRDSGWRRHPDLNWGIKVLQTSALPLGYGAGYK